MHGWRRLATGLALAGLVTALASGCASRSGSASGAGSAAGSGATAGSTATAKPGGNVPAFDKRAKLVAAAWDKAGLAKEWLTGLVLIIAPDELVIPGAKDFATGDQKMAFLDGRFALAGHLPTAPLTGKVRWPGGATATVPLLTAAQAYRKIATEQSCQGQPCPPSLVVTGAAPATVTVGTSRGKASVPAWTFTVPSIPSPITVVALAPGSYRTQPAEPERTYRRRTRRLHRRGPRNSFRRRAADPRARRQVAVRHQERRAGLRDVDLGRRRGLDL